MFKILLYQSKLLLIKINHARFSSFYHPVSDSWLCELIKTLLFLFNILKYFLSAGSSTFSLFFFITTYLATSFKILWLLSFIKIIFIFLLNNLLIYFWFYFTLFWAVETIGIKIVFFFWNVTISIFCLLVMHSLYNQVLVVYCWQFLDLRNNLEILLYFTLGSSIIQTKLSIVFIFTCSLLLYEMLNNFIIFYFFYFLWFRLFMFIAHLFEMIVINFSWNWIWF